LFKVGETKHHHLGHNYLFSCGFFVSGYGMSLV